MIGKYIVNRNGQQFVVKFSGDEMWDMANIYLLNPKKKFFGRRKLLLSVSVDTLVHSAIQKGVNPERFDFFCEIAELAVDTLVPRHKKKKAKTK